MRTVLNLSPLRKLCSKIEPVSTLRSLALMTAPARASLMCSTVTMDSSWPSISNIVPLRKSLVLIKSVQKVHRQEVSLKAESGNHAACRACSDAARPKLLARVDVRDVHLHRRQSKRLQAVVQRDRVVGERCRVDHDTGRSGSLLLEEVDDLALAVALEKSD